MGRLTLAFVALLAASCTSATSPDQSVAVPFVRVRPDAGGLPWSNGYEQPDNFVVRDSGAWQSTWTRIYRGHSSVPPLPSIDFSTDMVVVVALGAKPSSGYAVEIVGASEAGNVVTIAVTPTSPGPRCITLAVITQPIDVVRMPRRDGRVRFQFNQPNVLSCS